MKTNLDCIPCFYKQALEFAKLADSSEETQKMVLDEIAKVLPKVSMTASPPELSRIIYGIVKSITQTDDPYIGIKKKSNTLALAIYKKLKRKICHSQNRLLTAVELAIAGNIIDYGVKNSLDVDAELNKILKDEHKSISHESKALFNYPGFKCELNKAKTILYLADNAGETVFDRLLIEEIKKLDGKKRVLYVIKEKPIINDALFEDAIMCGIDTIAEIISSGSDAPGTVLSLCSKNFLDIYRKADMIISKGQGNFEALSEDKKPIYFLFMVKCPVIARHVSSLCGRCKVGDIVLYYNGKKV